jgi:DnaJ-domain-containing protein 1
MPAGRTLHVRCTTWEQVEIFYTRKLRRGKLLSMKVPFRADVGAQVTLGLELPTQVVIAIEGRIQKATPIEADAAKTWIEIELVGFTDEVVGRLKAMMAGAELPEDPTPPPLHVPTGRVVAGGFAPPSRPPPLPPPSGDELPTDEHRLFMHLTGELRRLRQLAVHEVLGVDHDADADAIRIGWMRLVRRHHPDLVARHRAPAISHLAEELTILGNRAYDRLRAALVLEGRATAAGSVLQQPAGWLVGFDDIGSRAAPVGPPDAAAIPVASGAGDVDSGDLPSVVQGGETFENRAREMLSNGLADHAQEVLAAALCVYPRSRPLRSLYYVASALAALMKGERMLATSQLETALAHYEHCVEAAQILDYMSTNAQTDDVELRRFFR